MSSDSNDPDRGEPLRQRAIEKMPRAALPTATELAAMSPAEIGHVFHELHVYQVELEMQSEDLRQRQGELDAARARYVELYDTAPVGYMTISSDGRIADANLTAAKLLNVPRESLFEQPFTRYIYSDDQDIFYLYSKHELEADLPRVAELRMLRSGLPPFDARIEATTMPLADGRRGVRAVISDVSDRREIERERERLLAAVEQCGDAVSVADPTGVIQYVNHAFEGMTGYARDDVIGKHVSILDAQYAEESIYRDSWAGVTLGQTYHGRVVRKLEDESQKTATVTVAPVRNASGAIVNVVTVEHDVSQELRLEAKLHHAARMESVGLLAGGVAHDFNNMLQVIVGCTHMARHKLAADHPASADLKQIQSAAELSAGVVKQLLAYAQRQPVIPESLNLNHEIERLLTMLRRLAGAAITFHWQPADDLWQVNGSRSQLDQVLVNLCLNARDAIAAAGAITFATRNVSVTPELCGLFPQLVPGDYAVITVADDGCGMEQSTLSKAFDPFFSTKEEGKGIGLGLSMVYGIVKQHFGHITVESRAGVGTTFSIYLPRHHEGSDPVPAAAETEPRYGYGEAILVVEEMIQVKGLLNAILTNQGYQVLTAATQQEAFSVLESHAGLVALVISDLMSPQINGPDLAKRLRTLQPHLKVLFMSGQPGDAIAKQGISVDDADFILKPIDQQALVAAVSEILARDS